MPTEFYFEFSQLISTEKLQSRFFTVIEHSTVTSQTQISVIQGQNQKQPKCSH